MKYLRLLLILFLFAFLFGCSSSNAPQAGSPAWLWAAAHDAYNVGDYEKTCDHLEKIENLGNNPYVDRARAWRLVLEAGSANAQIELAKAYAEGWHMSRTEKLAFQKQKNAHLDQASRHAIDLYEGFGNFAKKIPDKIELEFSFPQGSAGQVAELDRVYRGLNVSEAQRAAVDDKMMKRGIIRMVDSAVATEDDMAAAESAFKSGKVEIPAARYMLAMAITFDRCATIYDNKHLAEGDKLKLLRDRALETAKQVLELKPDAETEKAAKQLVADIEKGVKATDGKKKGRA